MSPTIPHKHLEKCWEACWHRARRPVEGVLVPEQQASEIAERVMRNLALDFEALPPEAEFAARVIQETASVTRELVAEKRRREANPQIHHDPEDRRYQQNLDLDRLQSIHPESGFNDPEWNRLPQILRPLALSTLTRKGIKGADAEDVFSDTLVELVRERESSHSAPILDPTVFEELIPLHARIVQYRAIDWYRRRGALKNQPNAGESLDALSDDPDHPLQFEDSAGGAIRFETIYQECREALTATEWQLIYTLYVSQSATIQDLIQNDRFCDQLGIKPGASLSTRRRAIGEMVEEALEKIRENLVF
ncbi:sigma-70 family RNA polymerase sigma factor [Luteolibacter marinus]|uniref:sigma-70 family RNA polymerase sigma factor n=1 Tax=Luteolibacter marinus TaxID=2776705 RepID=UPI00186857BC|nr:sigma-70 family RNA polymerase sigma factor [Luteolibacter marinus]